MTDKNPTSFEQFLKKYIEYGNYHQLGGDYRGMDEEYVAKFKELTSKIDFNCQFENGLCARERKGKGLYAFVEEPNPKCCCEYCAGALGHLKYISSIEVAKEIYKYYDKNNGFWSKTGCKLPRKWRSEICLTYSCGVPRKHFKTEHELREILDEGLIAVDNYFFKYLEKEGETEQITYTDYRHPGKVFEMTIPKERRGRYGSSCKSEDVYKHLLKRITASYSNHMRAK